MDTKNDFFQRKLSNTRSFVRQKKISRNRIVGLLILFLLAGVCVLWKLFWAPVNLENVDSFNENLSLGQEVMIQGEIKADGDFTTHTHTITDDKYGVIGIKSSEFNLSDYVGFVELTGVVEKFNQDLPIVRVLELSGTLLAEDEETDIILDEKSGVYLPEAGIQFLPSFFDEYVLLNEGENGEIKIQDIELGSEIVINYFRCNASDPNRNCRGLNDTFANNSAQSFVTSEGDTYYKQSEVQSWFVSNGDWWGIFINDVSDDVVFKLKDLIKFANQKNMDEWIKSRAIKLCQGSGEKMQKIEDSNIVLKQEGLIATISGQGKEKQLECQILVDLSLPNKGILQNMIIGGDIVDNMVEDGEDNTINGEVELAEENQKTDSTFEILGGGRNPNVEQFPVKTDGLIYSSSRGQYTLQFPSSNISYVVSPVKESFGQNKISCSYVINVIKYSEKEKLEISPAVRIYECSAQGNVAPWADNYVVYNVLDKSFIVQINDSSWIDFSKNLQFKALGE